MGKFSNPLTLGNPCCQGVFGINFAFFTMPHCAIRCNLGIPTKATMNVASTGILCGILKWNSDNKNILQKIIVLMQLL